MLSITMVYNKHTQMKKPTNFDNYDDNEIDTTTFSLLG